MSPSASFGSQLRYGSGRVVAVASQAGIAIVLARTLDRESLGLFSFVFVLSATVGMLTGLSARRLVMHRERQRDSSDILVAVMAAGVVGVFLTGWFASRLGGALGWPVGIAVATWRLADALGEVGQGWLCLDGRFGVSGALQAARSAGTFLGVAIGVLAGRWVAGLVLAAGVRLVVSALEVATSRPVLRRRPSARDVLLSVREGLRFSSINCAILAVEALPTAGISIFGGLPEAALITPLGRFRQGLHVAAGSLSEVTYPASVRAGAGARRQLSIFLGNVRYLAFPIAAGLVFAAADGGRLVFGSILDGERLTVAAAVFAGAAIGLSTLYSATLTARNLVGIQVLLFSLYALAVVVGNALFGWSASNMYWLQGIAGIVILLAFLAWDWRRESV